MYDIYVSNLTNKQYKTVNMCSIFYIFISQYCPCHMNNPAAIFRLYWSETVNTES